MRRLHFVSRLLPRDVPGWLRVPGITTVLAAARREANREAPGPHWVAELLTIAGSPEPLYLCAVLDCHSGRCIAWRCSETANPELIADAVGAAGVSEQPLRRAGRREGGFAALTLSRRLRKTLFREADAVPAPPPAERVGARFREWIRADLLLSGAWRTSGEACMVVGIWIDAYYNPEVTTPAISLRGSGASH